MQRHYYKKILQGDMTNLKNIIMQLRKCSNHPYLFPGAEPGPPYIPGPHLIENAGKMVLLDKLLTKLQQEGSRVLIFSQMTSMLDIFEDYCTIKKYGYYRIDGVTDRDTRDNHIANFNEPGSEKFIFMLSTRAGGVGINLATADVVILYDSDWNPQVDLQAIGRAHRIGQKKPVKVFRFITENSVEERIVDHAARKLKLDALVNRQTRHAPENNQTSKETLMGMIKFGAEDIINEKTDDQWNEFTIDEILRRGETLTKKKEDSRFKEDPIYTFTLPSGTGSVYEWDGKNYKNPVPADFTPANTGRRLRERTPCTLPKKTISNSPIILPESVELSKVDPSWSNVDHTNYIHACQKLGRTKVKEVPGKSQSEFEHYHAAFWKVHGTSKDKYCMESVKRIECGELRIKRWAEIDNKRKSTWRPQDGEMHKKRVDQLSVLFGYENWKQLRAKLDKEWKVCRDWFTHLRMAANEKDQRVDSLKKIAYLEWPSHGFAEKNKNHNQNCICEKCTCEALHDALLKICNNSAPHIQGDFTTLAILEVFVTPLLLWRDAVDMTMNNVRSSTDNYITWIQQKAGANALLCQRIGCGRYFRNKCDRQSHESTCSIRFVELISGSENDTVREDKKCYRVCLHGDDKERWSFIDQCLVDSDSECDVSAVTTVKVQHLQCCKEPYIIEIHRDYLEEYVKPRRVDFDVNDDSKMKQFVNDHENEGPQALAAEFIRHDQDMRSYSMEQLRNKFRMIKKNKEKDVV